MKSKTVRFLPEDHLVQVKGEESVLEVALRHGIEIAHSCGGMGSCTTCRIFVVSAGEEIPPRSEIEEEILGARAAGADERLSCQLPPLKDLVVRLPTAFDDDAST